MSTVCSVIKNWAVVTPLRTKELHKIKPAGLWELASSFRAEEASPSHSEQG